MSSELGMFYRSKVSAGPHVLVATDRNLYAMKLSGRRLLDVGDVGPERLPSTRPTSTRERRH